MFDLHNAIVLLKQVDELEPEHREFVDVLAAHIECGEVVSVPDHQLQQIEVIYMRHCA